MSAGLSGRGPKPGGYSFLIVDDMTASRMLIARALDKIGCPRHREVDCAMAALRVLSEQPIDVVLSDYNMPDIDGLDLLETLRGAPATQDVGFILITSRPTQQIAQRGRNLGLNNLVLKPFTPPTLRRAIEAVVGPV